MRSKQSPAQKELASLRADIKKLRQGMTKEELAELQARKYSRTLFERQINHILGKIEMLLNDRPTGGRRK